MKQDINSTINATIAALQPIDPSQHRDHILSAVRNNIPQLAKALHYLREYLIHEVHGPAAEIEFFKTLKPRIHTPLIHHHQVLSIFSQLPVSGKHLQQQYLLQQVNQYQAFLDSYSFLRQYLTSGHTYLDDKLFVRGNPVTASPVPGLEADPLATTGYDYLLAALSATQQTLTYIQILGDHIDNPLQAPVRTSTLVWSDSKRALIELAYALHEAGAFNNGNAELKEVLEGLEIAFNIKLGNASRTFSEILARKSGDANYMELLVEKLKQRIAKIDERHFRRH